MLKRLLGPEYLLGLEHYSYILAIYEDENINNLWERQKNVHGKNWQWIFSQGRIFWTVEYI